MLTEMTAGAHQLAFRLLLVASDVDCACTFAQERLALIWREKLTKQLHAKYFNKMVRECRCCRPRAVHPLHLTTALMQAFYKLSHLNEAQISDVEERIVKDPRRFCKSLAEEMEKFSAVSMDRGWVSELGQEAAQVHLICPCKRVVTRLARAGFGSCTN